MKPDFNEAGVLRRSEMYIPYPSDFAKKNLFWTDRCGWYFVNRNYMTSRITPYEWRFIMFYIIKGEMTCITPGREETARSGDMVFIDARHPHIYAANTDTEFFWIHFDGNCSESVMERICSRSNIYTLPIGSGVSRMLYDFFNGLQKGDPIPEEKFSAYVHTILSESLSLGRSNKNADESFVQKIIGFIEVNYNKNISFEELAKENYTGLSYMSQKFKRMTGYSPKQYLMKVRLNAACVLLKSTHFSVAEIARRCGFSSDHYFTSYFKNAYGITPSEYRRPG